MTYATIERRYRVPDVRLAVTNTELAVLRSPGREPWLATSAGSTLRQNLVLIRPDGEHRLIPSEHAGLMMQADEAGRLVLGAFDRVAKFLQWDQAGRLWLSTGPEFLCVRL